MVGEGPGSRFSPFVRTILGSTSCHCFHHHPAFTHTENSTHPHSSWIMGHRRKVTCFLLSFCYYHMVQLGQELLSWRIFLKARVIFNQFTVGPKLKRATALYLFPVPSLPSSHLWCPGSFPGHPRGYHNQQLKGQHGAQLHTWHLV